jgi:hypothetical protein
MSVKDQLRKDACRRKETSVIIEHDFNDSNFFVFHVRFALSQTKNSELVDFRE